VVEVNGVSLKDVIKVPKVKQINARAVVVVNGVSLKDVEQLPKVVMIHA
jgi:hypothetical protein